MSRAPASPAARCPLLRREFQRDRRIPDARRMVQQCVAIPRQNPRLQQWISPTAEQDGCHPHRQRPRPENSQSQKAAEGPTNMPPVPPSQPVLCCHQSCRLTATTIRTHLPHRSTRTATSYSPSPAGQARRCRRAPEGRHRPGPNRRTNCQPGKRPPPTYQRHQWRHQLDRDQGQQKTQTSLQGQSSTGASGG